MNGFVAKIAKLAVSKAAGFGYAVAVGVAGNVAFHYLQPLDARATAPATVVAAPAGPAPPSLSALASAPMNAAPAVSAVGSPSRPVKPTAPGVVATAPVLPPPPATLALPRSDALAAPALKPAVLPSEVPPASAAPAPAVPADMPDTAPAPGLSRLGLAIEVGVPPSPPDGRAAVAAAPRELPPTAAMPRSDQAPQDFAISDIWHPGRVVGKGLHWAGRQVSLSDQGETAAALPLPGVTSSRPIPLLPAAGALAAPIPADGGIPRKPMTPGPGSGGLY